MDFEIIVIKTITILIATSLFNKILIYHFWNHPPKNQNLSRFKHKYKSLRIHSSYYCSYEIILFIQLVFTFYSILLYITSLLNHIILIKVFFSAFLLVVFAFEAGICFYPESDFSFLYGFCIFVFFCFINFYFLLILVYFQDLC